MHFYAHSSAGKGAGKRQNWQTKEKLCQKVFPDSIISPFMAAGFIIAHLQGDQAVPVAQWIARRTSNPEVVGSSPTRNAGFCQRT